MRRSPGSTDGGPENRVARWTRSTPASPSPRMRSPAFDMGHDSYRV